MSYPKAMALLEHPDVYLEELELDLEGLEVPVEVVFRYERGDPGCTSGPPEVCYPPEDEQYEVYFLFETATKADLSCLLDIDGFEDVVVEELKKLT